MFKFLLITSLLWSTGHALALDTNCETNMMSPQLQITIQNQRILVNPDEQPAQSAISQESVQGITEIQTFKITEELEAGDQELEPKPSKEASPLGGMFDILLPSKLRNPTK